MACEAFERESLAVQIDKNLLGLSLFKDSCRKGAGPLRRFSGHQVTLSRLMELDLSCSCEGKALLGCALCLQNSSCGHRSLLFSDSVRFV